MYCLFIVSPKLILEVYFFNDKIYSNPYTFCPKSGHLQGENYNLYVFFVIDNRNWLIFLVRLQTLNKIAVSDLICLSSWKSWFFDQKSLIFQNSWIFIIFSDAIKFYSQRFKFDKVFMKKSRRIFHRSDRFTMSSD